ncbi:MAG: four helix bundle protein [Bacteroidota bacterium]
MTNNYLDYFVDLENGSTAEVSEPDSGYSKSDKKAFVEELQKRTKAQAISVINLIERTPFSPGMKVLGNQIIKSATSTAANYRAACRARSKNEFFAKMSIVVEESDETVF